MTTFAERVIRFNQNLHYNSRLPGNISVMNPFRENNEILSVSSLFYRKFYSDNNKRILILGINPGRLGAGATGIPFTDTKRLKGICDIQIESITTHEPSSVFIYEMIEAFGDVKKFYSAFYINSVCPLGFVKINSKGKAVNCNYYDDSKLQEAVTPFIKWNLREQVKIGCSTRTCYCLGSGKNFKFLKQLNDAEKYFEEIIPLEHPRFIIQYKLAQKRQYIDDYLKKLSLAH